MKSLKISAIPLLALIFVFSCELNDSNEDISKDEHSLYITGIKESITYEFTSGNGRAVQADEVKHLSVYIIDSDGNIAYETRYYNYGNEGIPDSIFIPALAEDNYTIFALTADYYPYYDYYYAEGDTMSILNNLVIPTYITSESPIFVGFEEIVLNQEASVQVDMKNISAKITFNVKNAGIAESTSIALEMQTVNPMDYNIIEEKMVPSSYSNNYLYNYIDMWMPERTIYILPQTLANMSINFYDYQTGTYWNNSITFDQEIGLTTGDAITFSLDMDALLEGSGTGIFNYEDIEWNDLGEVVVP